MSDFLDILAARIRPVAPPIEPRRALLFESAARETLPVELVTQETASSASPAPPTPLPALTEVQRLPGPQFQPAPVSAPQSAPEPTVTSLGILPSARPAAAPVFESVGVVAAQGKPAASPPEKDSAVGREVAPAPSPNFVAPMHSIVEERTISAPPTRIVAAAHIESLNTPSPSEAGPLLAQPVVRLIEPSARASAAPAAKPGPAETPVIRVTIGRVEVRAVVPPAPQQAPPPAARKSTPVISLDDYLKQQSSSGARA